MKRKQITIIAFCYLFLTACTSNAAEVPEMITVNGRQWKLIWHDEFNGNQLDENKWNVIDGIDGLNYNQILYDTPDNVSVQDGRLTITQTNDCHIKGEDGKIYTYCSGKVTTQNKFELLYGRVELRAKPPAGRGFHTAYWLLHHGCPGWAGGREVNCLWPPEIDIGEILGEDSQTAYVGYHFGTWELNSHLTKILETEIDLSANFHTYAVEWDPDQIRWYFDGEEIYFVDQPVVKQAHYPFIIVLDTIIGGQWPAPPDDSTPFPSNNQIEYVRVYKDATQPNPPTPQPTVTTNALDRRNTIPDWIAVSSPEVYKFPAQQAIDGDPETWWTTGEPQQPGQFFQIDLGQKLLLNRVALDSGTLPELHDGFPHQYEVYLSDDGKDWGDPIASGTGTEPLTNIHFEAKIAQHILIVQTGWADSQWAIFEATVFYNDKVLNRER